MFFSVYYEIKTLWDGERALILSALSALAITAASAGKAWVPTLGTGRDGLQVPSPSASPSLSCCHAPSSSFTLLAMANEAWEIFKT